MKSLVVVDKQELTCTSGKDITYFIDRGIDETIKYIDENLFAFVDIEINHHAIFSMKSNITLFIGVIVDILINTLASIFDNEKLDDFWIHLRYSLGCRGNDLTLSEFIESLLLLPFINKQRLDDDKNSFFKSNIIMSIHMKCIHFISDMKKIKKNYLKPLVDKGQINTFISMNQIQAFDLFLSKNKKSYDFIAQKRSIVKLIFSGLQLNRITKDDRNVININHFQFDELLFLVEKILNKDKKQINLEAIRVHLIDLLYITGNDTDLWIMLESFKHKEFTYKYTIEEINYFENSLYYYLHKSVDEELGDLIINFIVITMNNKLKHLASL